MAEKSVEKKPSETAVFAALHRAIANKEYKNERFGPDNLAEYFLPSHYRFLIKFKKVRANVKNKLNEAFPGLHEYMIARTAYFDRVFRDALNNKIPQIVLLGAGYDSRAYRYSKLNRATKIMELDIGPTQNRKKQCLNKAQIDIPEQVTLVSINFNKESIKNVLEKAGYENDKETLFLWEGVSYYLNAEAAGETLEFVSQSLSNESAIAFDYTISVSEENINQYGVKEFFLSMKEHHQEESLLFAIDDGKIELYLEQRGLKIVNHLDNDEIEREFLENENGSLIGRVTGHFRFVLASPKSY
jgi:methyltransferase (TIGR00027 family)